MDTNASKTVSRTPKATVAIESNGLLYVLLDEGTYITLDDMQEIISTARTITRGERMPMVIDASRHIDLHPRAQAYFRSVETQSVTYACAIIRPRRSYTALINLYLMLVTANYPLQTFSSEAKGRLWLSKARHLYDRERNPNKILYAKKLWAILVLFLLYAFSINGPGSYPIALTALGIIPIIMSGWCFGIKGGLLTGIAVSLAQVPVYFSINQNPMNTAIVTATSLLAYLALGYASGFCRQLHNKLTSISTEAFQNAARVQHTLKRFEDKDYASIPPPPQQSKMIADIWRSVVRLGEVLRHHHAGDIATKESLKTQVQNQTRELKTMQNQLLQASKLSALGTMSASLVHELNNPLAIMAGYLDILKNTKLPEDATTQFKRIEEALVRLQQTVDHLRKFSRRGQGTEYWRTANLSDIVSDAFIFLDPAIESAKISVSIDLCENPIPILGDAHLLENVIQNLVFNSRDAFEESNIKPSETRRISITTHRDTNFGYITYRDNAGGIPKEYIDKIFEPFFTTKKESEGTGLGLSIVKGVIEQHGGKITAETSSRDETTFHMRIPLAHADLKPESQSQKQRSKILIVDDEPDICRYLQAVLQEHFDVATAEHASTALDILKQEKFDLVISDVHMPDMNGAEFIEAIHNQSDHKIPVLLISGLHSKDETLIKALSLGASGFIPKPFSTVDHIMTQIYDLVDNTH